MYLRILTLLAALVVLVGTIAGCGTSSQQNAQSQGSGQKQSEQGREGTGKGKTKKKGTEKMESLDGTVARVLPEKNIVVVRPDNGEPVTFRYRPDKSTITLDGNEAASEDIEKGQTASVRYIMRTTEKSREVNVARSIELQSRDSGKTGGEATS